MKERYLNDKDESQAEDAERGRVVVAGQGVEGAGVLVGGQAEPEGQHRQDVRRHAHHDAQHVPHREHCHDGENKISKKHSQELS